MKNIAYRKGKRTAPKRESAMAAEAALDTVESARINPSRNGVPGLGPYELNGPGGPNTESPITSLVALGFR